MHPVLFHPIRLKFELIALRIDKILTNDIMPQHGTPTGYQEPVTC